MDKNTLRIVVSAVAAIVVLVGSFMIASNLAEMNQELVKKPNIKKVKEVDIFKAKNQDIPTKLDVDGSLVAFDKIDIFAEVSGTLVNTSRPFKVGSYFPKGSVLIQIDQEEAKLSLLSQKSSLLNAITQMMPDLKIDYPKSFESWNKYLEEFDIEKPIQSFPKPVDKQEKYFVATKNLYSQYYNIKSAEERLKKYTIYTPFSGVITQTSINPGAVVRVGQKLGELMNNQLYELEITVPFSELKYVKPGSKVTLQADGLDQQWEGKINRIDNQVDASTQTVKIFVGLSGRNLKEGMYMKGELEGTTIENAVKLPRSLLIDQKNVYVLQDTILKLMPVDIVKLTDQAAIVKGIEDGTPLLREVIPGLFDGVRVKVSGTITDSPEFSMN